MGYGWNVTRVGDANDLELITRAFETFRATDDRPTLIIVDSHIGYGSPHKQDTAAAHGEPLGEEEVRETKRAYGWPEDAEFLVPDGVREHFADGHRRARGRAAASEWERLLDALRARARDARAPDRRDAAPRAARGLGSRHPLVRAPTRRGWPPARPRTRSRTRSPALVPWLVAGSADLTDSTSVAARRGASGGDFEPGNRAGRQLHYGIREHESAAISNGLSLSKLRPLWSTYLVFSDYARPAIRLSALMELPVIHIFTHDSIGLGEDGPTHQPVEHLASLRAIPGLNVIRPCDANEVAEAWRVADGAPTTSRSALVLTRQNVPVLDRSRYASAEGLRRGGYVLADAEDGDPELILIATGSEVALAVEAHEQLAADGVRSRVVSLPVLPALRPPGPGVPRRGPAAVGRPPGSRSRRPRRSAGTATSARPGRRSACTPSAPRRRSRTCSDEFGFTPEKVVETARDAARRNRRTQMKPTQQLHDLGQSLWVDNITRTMLDDGTLAGYIDELSVTGLTSNPTIFDKAIGGGSAYDEQIAELTRAGASRARSSSSSSRSPTCAARPSCSSRSTSAPTASTAGSRSRSRRCSPTTPRRRSSRRPSSTARAEENFFIKIPGTEAGRKAIEETIFAGIPVNVTLLFSTEQYLGAADAYMRGLERRVEAGLNPDVASVASLFISRWDAAVADDGPRRAAQPARARGRQAHLPRPTASCSTPTARMRLRNEGARPQRLLWASTGTKDPDASDVLYIEGLAAPFTVNTMPEKTLHAFADHGDGRRAAAGRRRRRRGDAGGVRRRRDRHRRARGEAPGGRQGLVRRLLARAARHDRRADALAA